MSNQRRPEKEDRPEAKGIKVSVSDLGMLSNKPTPAPVRSAAAPISSRRTQEELLREQQLEEEHERMRAAKKDEEPSANQSNTWDQVLNDSSLTFGDKDGETDKVGEPIWPKKSQTSSTNKYANVAPVSWRTPGQSVRGGKLKAGN